MFEFMRKVFGAAGHAALDEIGKDASKAAVEGGLAAAVYVMFADGNADTSEKEKIRRLMETHPIFKKLDSTYRQQVYNGLVEAFETDYGIGREQALDALGRITEVHDKRTAVLIGCAVAKADGTVGDDEKKVIDRICQKLGLNSAEFFEA